MAVTILEASKNYEGDPLKQAVIETFAANAGVLSVLPFENTAGAGVKAKREDTLPRIDFRGVNATYTEGTGELEEIDESLKILGGNLDVDAFLIKTMGERQRAVQTQMKAKAAALKWQQTFFKGSVLTAPAGLDGLQVRLGDAASDQVIHAGATSGGDALSLLKLDELLDANEDSSNQVLMMNATMIRRLTAASRLTTVGGQINFVQNQMGQRVTQYNDVPIIKIKKDNEGNEILPFTEANPGAGTAASTSIYLANMEEGMLTGIQSSDMEVTDIGRLESGTAFRTLVEWYVNFVIWHPRAVSRLSGIKNAAVVA